MSKLKMSSWCIFFTWLEPSDLGSMELDTQNYYDNHARCQIYIAKEANQSVQFHKNGYKLLQLFMVLFLYLV